MKLSELLRNRLVRAVLILYVLGMALVFGLSFTGDSLPDEFPARPFALDDVFGGERVTLAAHEGHPVIIYFFASW